MRTPPLIRTLLAVARVSGIEGFHCKIIVHVDGRVLSHGEILNDLFQLIRKVVHQCFNLLHKNGWKER